MHFVRVYFMEYMKVGLWKNVCSLVPVRQLPVCPIQPARMDFVRLMIVLPLQTNSELVRTRANLF